jgi:hypothetical protein
MSFGSTFRFFGGSIGPIWAAAGGADDRSRMSGAADQMAPRTRDDIRRFLRAGVKGD